MDIHTYIHVNGSAVVIIRMHYTTQDAYYETACIDKSCIVIILMLLVSLLPSWNTFVHITVSFTSACV